VAAKTTGQGKINLGELFAFLPADHGWYLRQNTSNKSLVCQLTSLVYFVMTNHCYGDLLEL
jgi:hypothetical protein